MTIYLSTCCLKNRNIQKVCSLYEKNNIKNIEISFGLHDKSIKAFLIKKKKLIFGLHNYFPAPKKSFVFNLASVNKTIQNKSLKLAIKAINIASKINCKYYSFHAGYLIDPKPNELGGLVKKQKLQSVNESMEIFQKNVKLISSFAKKKKINLLVENNVIHKDEFLKFKKKTSLMCEPKEIIKIMKKMPTNVKLLLDVAHLKVSAKTLNFDLIPSIKKLNNWVGGYHLSDNNGKKDNNKHVKINSWFWPYLKKSLNYYSLEIYNNNIINLKKQIDLTNKKLSK